MTNNTHLKFLQEKIGEVRSALFFSQNNDLIKLPTSIITALKVDNDGHVWFFISRPTQYLEAFEKEFPARLDFFRKDKGHTLEVSGKAFIVNDPAAIKALTDLPDAVAGNAMHHLILIKIKIMNAKYYERKVERAEHGIVAFAKKISNRFFLDQQGYRPYTLRGDNIGIA